MITRQKHLGGVGIGAKDSDMFDLCAIQRQQAVVLQQHDRFLRNLLGQRPVLGGIVLIDADFRIRHHRRWIKHSQAKTGR